MSVFVVATGNTHKLREVEAILNPLGIAVITMDVAGIGKIHIEETGRTFEENARIKAETIMRLTGMAAIADDSGLEVDALKGAPGVWSARFSVFEGLFPERVAVESASEANTAHDPKTSIAEHPRANTAHDPKTSIAGDPKANIAKHPRANTAHDPKTRIAGDPKTSIAEHPKTIAETNPKKTGAASRPAHKAASGLGAVDAANNQKLLDLLDGLPVESRTARFVCAIAAIYPGGLALSVRGVCEGHIALSPGGCNGFGYDPVFIPSCRAAEGKTFADLSPDEKNAISHRGAALKKIAECIAAGRQQAMQ